MGRRLIWRRDGQARLIVRLTRGRYRGHRGRIAGTLEDRAARGITKAIVHVAGDVDLLETAWLVPAEPDLFEPNAAQTKTPPAEPAARGIIA